MDEFVENYFAAWNESDASRRRQLLSRCVESDAELVDPTGRWHGVDGFGERIERYQSAAPGSAQPTGGCVGSSCSTGRYRPASRHLDSNSDRMRNLRVGGQLLA